jgi:hypothetical protein
MLKGKEMPRSKMQNINVAIKFPRMRKINIIPGSILPVPKGWTKMKGMPILIDRKSKVRAEIRFSEIRLNGPVPKAWEEFIVE